MAKRRRAQKTSTDVRREQIVNAALGIVGREGVRGLTIAGIAREVGVVPSGIYRHFGGKSEVLDAIVEFVGSRLLSNVEAACVEASGARERLGLLFERHIGLIQRNQGIPRLIFSEDVAEDDSSRRHRLYEAIQSYRSRVAAVIRAGQDAGEICGGISAEAASLLFLGLIQPAAILWHISAGEFDVVSETHRCWRLFSRYVLADAGTDTEDTGHAGED